METDYEIGQQLEGHAGDVRCLAVLEDKTVLSGSLDKTVIVWKPDNNGKYKMIAKHTPNDGYIYCLTSVPNKASQYTEETYLSGSKDQSIAHVRVSDGNVLWRVTNAHDGAVSSITVTQDGDVLSGGWDGMVKCWRIDEGTEEPIWKGEAGKYAVTVAVSADDKLCFTGAQDGVIKFWNISDGTLLGSIPHAHEDIIRAFAVDASSGSFASVSNDCLVKVWPAPQLREDGEGYNLPSTSLTLAGHSGFVFGCDWNFDILTTASDDRNVKFWSPSESTTPTGNSLLHPGTVWCVKQISKGVIVSGCSDGIVRIWTNQVDLMAPLEERETLKSLAEASAAEAAGKGASAVPLDSVPDINTMYTTRGRKNGEVKMFRRGNEVIACQWASGAWQQIGVVTGKADKKQYPGDQYFPAGSYDYVFDVELGSTERMAQLPFNNGDNPLVTAEKFCAREQIDKSNIHQIMDFIKTNAQGGASTASSAPVAPQQPVAPQPHASDIPQNSVPSHHMKHFPLMDPILFKDAKFDPMKNKLHELNDAIPTGDKAKLTTEEMVSIDAMIDVLKTSSRNKKFQYESTYTLWSRLLPTWTPDQGLFAGVDLARMMLLEENGADVFKSADRGLGYVQMASKYLRDPTTCSSPLSICCSRFLANMAAFSTNRTVLCDMAPKVVLPAVTCAITQSTNKHTRTASASVIVNISEAVPDKALGLSYKAVIPFILGTLRQIQFSDTEILYRVIGGGNGLTTVNVVLVSLGCCQSSKDCEHLPSDIIDLLRRCQVSTEVRIRECAADILAIC